MEVQRAGGEHDPLAGMEETTTRLRESGEEKAWATDGPGLRRLEYCSRVILTRRGLETAQYVAIGCASKKKTPFLFTKKKLYILDK